VQAAQLQGSFFVGKAVPEIMRAVAVDYNNTILSVAKTAYLPSSAQRRAQSSEIPRKKERRMG
jgi:hypothetical protein